MTEFVFPNGTDILYLQVETALIVNIEAGISHRKDFIIYNNDHLNLSYSKECAT